MQKRKSGFVKFEKFERSKCIRETSIAIWFSAIMFVLLCFFVLNVTMDYKFN